jgi:hypothetical protein
VDKTDHTLAISTAATDPIYQSPPEFDSEGGAEVYMVGNEEELQDKMIKEIQRETDVELAHAACLAKVSERGKRNNNM